MRGVELFTKEIDVATAYLSVWFPSDFDGLEGPANSSAEGFGLSVTGSHDGAAWC